MTAPLTSNDNSSSYMLRDVRINQIGQGSNGALASYIGPGGIREPGWSSKQI